MTDLSVPSFSGRQWVDCTPACTPDHVRVLSERLSVSKGMAQLLAARKLGDVRDATSFLNPSEDQLHDPYLMKGMQRAVQRIRHAVDHFEKILVFGDWDVDGTASTSILYSYLKRLGARVFYYIPCRDSGYGFSPATLAIIADWNVNLVITTDHGSTDLEAPTLLRALGAELIITDHHQVGTDKRLPDAAALVNPNQPGCGYPFKELTATAVAYKVVCALDQALENDGFFDTRGICRTNPGYYLDLAALATVADMGPLVGENRTLVSLGLDMMNSNPRPGLAGLMRECMVRGPVTPSIISFKLAPKINALGRIGEPRLAVQLLLSHSYMEARRLARHMVNLNKQRQEIERRVYLRAMAQVELMKHSAAYILVGGDWHPGVLGSIATRIAIQTGKPTVVLTLESDGQATGSARSSSGYNILDKLARCETLLNRFGGHPCAAGLAVKADKLEDFRERIHAAIEDDAGGFCEERAKQLEIEAWITPEMLSPEFVQEINRLSPFGHGNREPVVAVRGLALRNPSVFNQRHLRFHLPLRDGGTLDAYAWEHAEWHVGGDDRYDVAFMPQIYNGPDGVKHQVKVVDLKASNS